MDPVRVAGRPGEAARTPAVTRHAGRLALLDAREPAGRHISTKEIAMKSTSPAATWWVTSPDASLSRTTKCQRFIAAISLRYGVGRD
jgi:hypothetical protein